MPTFSIFTGNVNRSEKSLVAVVKEPSAEAAVQQYCLKRGWDKPIFCMKRFKPCTIREYESGAHAISVRRSSEIEKAFRNVKIEGGILR